MHENWQDELKPILVRKIGEAMIAEELEDVLFPWIGDNCFRIMADAAIAVLRGMKDAQNYLREQDQLKE